MSVSNLERSFLKRLWRFQQLDSLAQIVRHFNQDNLSKTHGFLGFLENMITTAAETTTTVAETTEINSFTGHSFQKQMEKSSVRKSLAALREAIGTRRNRFYPENSFTIFPSPEAFTTVSTTGKLIKNGDRGDAIELKWTNSFTKADGTQATAVTFAFDDVFALNGISYDRAKDLFNQALQVWANHAPIEFQEIADPGSPNSVDIFIDSQNIDGPGLKLAQAYFPTFGDITFDNSENWLELEYLEAAVHEIGHALGLDHEDDVPAIMGSYLEDQFTDINQPFLLADDIAGIQSLYGKGIGSVQLLSSDGVNPISAPPPTGDAIVPTPELGPNLSQNNSFENGIPINVGEFGLYSRISGWSTISGLGFMVDKRVETFGQPTDGNTWASLDIYNTNATIGQNVDTLTGQRYSVSVDYSNGGQVQETTGIDVFWEGRKVDSITGGGAGTWQTFKYELVGGSRDVSTLAFRATGAADSIGGLIDNVSVRAILAASPPPSAGLSAQQATTGLPKDDAFSSAVATHSLMDKPFTVSSNI